MWNLTLYSPALVVKVFKFSIISEEAVADESKLKGVSTVLLQSSSSVGLYSAAISMLIVGESSSCGAFRRREEAAIIM